MADRCNSLWQKRRYGRYKQFVDPYQRPNVNVYNTLVDIVAPTFTPNNYAAFPLNSIQIDRDKDVGRFIKTTKNVAFNQPVINVLPFATSVQPTDVIYCDFCHKIPEIASAIRCENCQRVFYCSPVCMLIKKSTHDLVCGTDFHKINDLDVKCTIQMVLEAITTFKTVKELIKFVERTVLTGEQPNNLSIVIPQSVRTRKEQLACILSLHRKTLDAVECRNTDLAISYLYGLPKVRNLCPLKGEQRFLQQLIRIFYAVVISNSFSDSIAHQGGKIDRRLIYDVFSLFNHSCVPNVRTTIDGITMKGSTIQPVAAGNQLTISYIVTVESDANRIYYKSKTTRREHLEEKWQFECNCSLCMNDPSDPALEDFKKALNKGQRQLEKSMRQQPENNLDYYVKLVCYMYFLTSENVTLSDRLRNAAEII